MAESSTGAYIGFPPFNSGGDILFDESLSSCIENIPPSASAPSEEQSQTGSARCESRNGLTEEQKQELLKEINELETPEEIKSVIQKCRSLGLDLDINRLVRFAIRRDYLLIVKYLVEEENADLTRRDIFDRYAIFYLRNPSPELLEYLSKHDCFTVEHLNYLDKKKWSPLHYAVKNSNFHHIKHLLIMGANAEMENFDHKMPIELIDTNGYRWRRNMLLFAFWKLRQLYPHLTNVPFHDSHGNIVTKQLDIHPDFRLFEGGGVNWCHIPWTNGIIVFAALRELGRYNHSFFADDIYGSWFQGATPVLSNPKLYCRKPSYESKYSDPKPYISMVFPFLVLQTKENHMQSREDILKFRLNIPNDFAQSVVQVEQTLDETYYSTLSTEALAHRNNDQVVSRECVETLSGKQLKYNERPILIVSQLWLWKDGNCILTAYTEEGPRLQPIPETTFPGGFENTAEVLKLDQMVLEDENSDYISALHAARIITNRLSKFGESQAGGELPSPLDIFEIGVVRILSDVEAYTDPNKQLLPEDIEKERNFMHRIADVKEELAMVQEILDQQKEILRSLIQDIENHEFRNMSEKCVGVEKNYNEGRWEKLKLSAKDVDGFQKRVSKIGRDAERIENLIQNQLNMKRTYASIRDARTGLILSAAVIGFTVITIIFAPLAFITSLFALPLEGFLKNQYQLDGGNGIDPTAAYTTKYVAIWFVVAEAISLLVTIFLVALCLWYFGVHKNLSMVRENHSSKNMVVDDRRRSKTKSSRVDKTTRSVGEKKSGSDQEKTGMRRKTTKLWSRSKQGESGLV
ncbi:hypothetical protein F4813DRAFT_373216 [Daldinia decipiens]|uniref:uncharacterized protein n=1 Tax=Daldinia decipiens TaxID=326647 RepID=UPI0020C5183F|nr:uncharacterized protein F4813DRAFT_373216 [Daldinia decipiens]KAI1653919.1 hypothetical protein F4813DRAFT_373216 [Daldinia decipiens]